MSKNQTSRHQRFLIEATLNRDELKVASVFQSITQNRVKWFGYISKMR